MTNERDAILAYIDQATYLSWRATDRGQLVQYVWVYERPVDMEQVERFHRNFGHGLAGRLIEPSPLPFGRHRWVSAPGPAAPLDVAEVRAPSELGAWIDERSQVRIDPVLGPGWQLGVLPMADGTTAISLVMSHCVIDGGGSMYAVSDAINGRRRNLGYPQRHSRTRVRALGRDVRQVLRDLPEFARTVAVAARFAYRRRGQISASGASRPSVPTGVGGTIVLPAVSVIVEGSDWDARAGELGGNGYALLAGFSARMGQRLGRVRPSDGAVTLLVAVADRAGAQDTRANAMKIATAVVDPSDVCSDLTATRSAIRTARAALHDEPDEMHALLPVTPFVPKRAVRRTSDVVFGDLPVTCSNVGDVFPDIARIDGTDADYMVFRPADQNVSRDVVERAGGQLVVASGRVGGKVSIGVIGYEVGAANTREWLAEHVAAALADFKLKGTTV